MECTASSSATGSAQGESSESEDLDLLTSFWTRTSIQAAPSSTSARSDPSGHHATARCAAGSSATNSEDPDRGSELS